MALIENTMYQPIPTSEYFDGMAYEEPLSTEWNGVFHGVAVGLTAAPQDIGVP